MEKNCKDTKRYDKIIAVRFTAKEQKCIRTNAKKEGMTMSAYIRGIVLHDRKRIENPATIQTIMGVAVQAKEILNYITEKYGEDEILEKKVKKLWKNLL